MPNTSKSGLEIVVFGGRDYADRAYVYDVLNRLHHRCWITLVIDGGAAGADTLGHEWAVARGVPTRREMADWKTRGRRAGPERNQRIADLKPDLGVGFPGGAGTADMRRRLAAANIAILTAAGKSA